jgi:heme/copper-type cytochrome/quinol oxidase subunit 3
VATVDHHAGHEEHQTSTGITNNKMMMWAFLASDCMFFGTLIMMYMVYRPEMAELGGLGPNDVLDIPFSSLMTFVLLMSSLAFVLGLSALQRGNHAGMRIWLSATALLGLLFLGGEGFEYMKFWDEGVRLGSNIFGTAYFVTTGFHKIHVAIGVIWLLGLVAMSYRGQIHQHQSEKVEIAGLYWHFVDIVWIVIFTFIFLVPYR